jgi:hypothetical protein
MRRKVKKGSGLFGTVADVGLWGIAYENSDGSFWSVLKLRLWYGFIILAVLGLPIMLFFIFAKKTPAPNTPETKKSK